MRRFLEQTWLDARHGARSLIRDRAFTLVAVLTLAIGVALNATMFSVASAILFRPPPFANPEQLVIVDNQPPNSAGDFVSAAEFFDYRRLSRTSSGMALVQSFNANITGGDHPDRVDAVAVSPNFFTLLGVPPVAGRTFVSADEQPGFTQIAVISYGLWERVFGGASNTIGRKVRLDEDDYTIVGVMPPAFKHPIDRPGAPVEVWLPTGYRGAPWPVTPVRNSRSGDVLVRLKPGASLADVRGDFDRIDAELVASYPADYGGAGTTWRILVRPLDTVMAGTSGKPLALLLGAVVFVLLIACTNVASLVLARGASRRAEVAVRAAIGADQWRLVRALFTQYLLLTVAGGCVGTLLAVAGVGAVRRFAPPTLPRRDEIVMDTRVLIFVVACSVLVGLLVGVLPALAGARTPLSEVLKAGGRASTSAGGGHRVRSTLVVIELALSVLLLAGAGLVAHSFWKVQQVDLGFEPNHLLTTEITVSLPNDRSLGKYVAPAPRAQLYEDILNRVKALPGVLHVAETNAVPLRDPTFPAPVSVDGHVVVSLSQLPQATFHAVSGDYFSTMQTKLVRGNGVSDQDRLGMPINVVLSQTAARAIFGSEDPIGKRIKRGPAESPAPWMTVIGIAADAKLRSADAAPEASVFLSMQQSPPITMALLVRSMQDPGLLAPKIVDVIHSVDRDQPVYHTETMTAVVGNAIGERRFAAWMFVLFAVLSLGLAAIGVYGLVAQSVAQRRREIGLRMALGADAASVVRLIVRESLRLAGLGAVAGLVLSLALTRLLQSQLFGVSAYDPIVFGLLAPVLLVVAAAAAYVPGRAASRLNPVTALRAD